MKSLKRRFVLQTQKWPGVSSYICLVKSVRGQGFTKDTISFWFRRLVDKSDYDRKDKQQLIKGLVNLSNGTEEVTKQEEIAPP